MSHVMHHVNAKISILGTIHNGGNIWWVVFVFECVILNQKFTRNVTKWQVTNTDNKNYSRSSTWWEPQYQKCLL